MKGLKLFVRLGDTPDVEVARGFLKTAGVTDSPLARAGTTPFLIGKLLGDLVAVLAFDLDGADALRVDCIVVASGLRRKRIGRAMLLELETVAAKLERPKIVFNETGEAAEFFRRVGFTREGENWVKVVASQLS